MNNYNNLKILDSSFFNQNRYISTKTKLSFRSLIIIVIVQAIIFFLFLKTSGNNPGILFLTYTLLIISFAIRNFAFMWVFCLMMLPFFSLFTSIFDIPAITGIRIIMVEMLLVYILFLYKRESHWKNFLHQPSFVFFSLFILGNFISSIFNQSVDSLLHTVTYLEPLCFYGLTYIIVRKRWIGLKEILLAILSCGLIIGLFGIIEVFFQSPIINILRLNVVSNENFAYYLTIDRFGLGGRIVSIIGQPVYTGLYFGVWLIIAVFYIVINSPKKKFLLFIAFVFGLFLVFATGSRAPIIALVFVVIVFLIINRKKIFSTWFSLIISILIMSVTITILIPSLPNYFQASFDLDRFSDSNANLLGRINLSKEMINLAKSNPIFGYGPGMIQKSNMTNLLGLENQYTTIFAEGGVFAGLPYLLFVIYTMILLIKKTFSKNLIVSHSAILALLLFTFYFVFVISATCLVLPVSLLLMALLGSVVAIFNLFESSENGN